MIQVYIRARPMTSAGEILREWQRRFPGRFVDAHLNSRQHRLREIRAHLLALQATSSIMRWVVQHSIYSLEQAFALRFWLNPKRSILG
jgi:hypothetical protein